MSIQEKALTVNLFISTWTARKHDKKISAEVEREHNATNAGRYNKILIDPADEDLKAIQQKASAARSFHYENTLPWSDDGRRLLPSENYFSYCNQMQTFDDEILALAKVFGSKYEDKLNAARYRLNGMYNPSDYPSKAEILGKFSFKIEFEPISNTADFRIDLTETEIKTLRLGMENSINDKLKGAMQDIKNRIKEQLDHMRAKLSNANEIFRDSLFENLRDIINLIPKLNVTNDPQVNEICEDMKSILVEDPDSVRQNNMLRSKKAAEVDAILDKFESFF